MPADGLLGILRAHARAPGDAVVSETASLSRSALAALVAAAAEALAARGIGPGMAVGITLRDETEHLVASLALLALGAPQVSLASFDPPAVREGLADRVGAAAVLVDEPRDALAGRRAIAWHEIRAGLATGAPPAGPPRPDPDAPAIFLSGSGVSGRPKIVAFSLRQLVQQAERNYPGYDGGRMFRFASVEHNNSKRLRLYTILRGGTAVFAAARGEALLRFLAAARADWVDGSLVHCADLVALGRRGLALSPGMAMRVGGLRVPHAVRREVLEHVTPQFWVSYGATEIGGIAIAAPHQHDQDEPVGPPLAGVEVAILRADGTEAPAGEPGLIRIRAPGMAQGYHDDPAETERRFRGGWFHPGDIVTRRPDGSLVIQGRSDDMMILNGINIFPAEIEAVMEGHPAVANAAALPLRSQAHGQIPIAAVELLPGTVASDAELLGFARARLGLRAPRRVLVLPALPRNPQGKVLKREIATLVDPRNGTEGA